MELKVADEGATLTKTHKSLNEGLRQAFQLIDEIDGQLNAIERRKGAQGGISIDRKEPFNADTATASEHFKEGLLGLSIMNERLLAIKQHLNQII